MMLHNMHTLLSMYVDKLLVQKTPDVSQNTKCLPMLTSWKSKLASHSY